MRHAILAIARCIWGRGVTLAETLNEQVMRLLDEDKYAEAEPLALQALEVSLKKNGPDHPDTATSLYNLAKLYDYDSDTQAHDLAEPLYKRALARHEKFRGPDHEDTATSLNNLAELYNTQGKYDLAEPFYRRAWAIREPLYKGAVADTEDEFFFRPDHASTATALNNLAELYNTQGEYDLAEPFYKRALAIYEKVFGPDHEDTDADCITLAWFHDTPPGTATALTNLASLCQTQEKYDLAEPLYKRALAIRQEVLGPDHEDTATALNNLAELYKIQGKYDLAEPPLCANDR